jgi:small subunit ribosomal protein S20
VANIQSAKKRARQADKRREHNVALRSRTRTAMKRVLKAVGAGDKAGAQDGLKLAVPAIDRLATKRLIPKNRAAKYKSRLNGKVRAMP